MFNTNNKDKNNEEECLASAATPLMPSNIAHIAAAEHAGRTQAVS